MPGRSELTVLAEPWAGGVQYLYHFGGAVRAGAVLTAGPFGGVTIARGTSGRLREWATAYPVLSLRTTSGFEVELSPIGAALAIGDDFGAIYPSGQALVGLARGRLQLGSIVRVIRIAGGHGTGIGWWQWIPVRIGFTLGR